MAFFFLSKAGSNNKQHSQNFAIVEADNTTEAVEIANGGISGHDLFQSSEATELTTAATNAWAGLTARLTIENFANTSFPDPLVIEYTASGTEGETDVGLAMETLLDAALGSAGMADFDTATQKFDIVTNAVLGDATVRWQVFKGDNELTNPSAGTVVDEGATNATLRVTLPGTGITNPVYWFSAKTG